MLKAFRMCGWFAYKPTLNGLVRASGEQLSKYPLGSSILSSKVIDQRFDLVDKDGLPKAPDWNELRDIRHRQNLVAASQANYFTSGNAGCHRCHSGNVFSDE